MKVTVIDREGDVYEGVGGGFLYNWADWEGNSHNLGFHLDFGDGSGSTWALDELASVRMDFDDGGEEE